MDAGTVVGGFRVVRLIGEGGLGAVYEAEELSLGRRVALRLVDRATLEKAGLAERFDGLQRLAASVDHPNLVPIYAIGEWDEGRFAATRLIRGQSVARLRESGQAPAADALSGVAAALAAAHAAGVVHGRVSARNVLIDADGRGYLADLGFGGEGSAAEDRRALDALIAELPSRTRVTGQRRGVIAVAVATLLAAGLAVSLSLAGGGDAGDVTPPPEAPGTVSVGSDLAATELEAVGCAPEPGPNTPACTLAPATVGGRAVAVRSRGVIRRWALRGASGELTLQIIRDQGQRPYVAAFAQPERLDDPDAHAFDANVAVRAGDRIGVGLGPGALIGASAEEGSSMLRWDETLPPRPSAERPTRLDGELMLRVDVDIGGRAELPPHLSGERAQEANRGRVLARATIELPSGTSAQLRVVEVSSGIALDLFRGGARIARLGVPDADPGGELLGLEQNCGGGVGRGFCLDWQNPGAGPALGHQYLVTAEGIRLIG